MVKLLLADPDPEFAKEIQLVIEKIAAAKIAAATSSLEDLPALSEEHQPAIIFLGPNFDTGSVSNLLQRETSRFAGVKFILLTPAQSGEVDVPESVALEKLSLPLHPEDLVKAVEEVTGPVPPAAAAAPHAKVITVFSTKGGVGKTMISSNLAVYLAKQTKKRVVVLDLDLQFGDVGVMLKLRPEHTIYDCVPITEELNEEVIEKFLTPHSSGARALLAPLQPEFADLVTTQHLKNVLDALKRYADIIVVDTPASFNDHVLTLLDETDTVLLVATMDVPSVKNVKLCLQTLESLRYPDEKIALTINRADENVGLKQHEIENALEKQAVVVIPTDKRVPLSINRGTPVVLEAPKSPAARALISLAEHLLKRLTSSIEVPTAA
jgi:pilus assembly protein CpaE